MPNKKLIVSLHDAAPCFQGELEEIVSELDQRKIQKRSVLVVPNWEYRHPLIAEMPFVEWLHDQREKGSEIVQHGYAHCSPIQRNYSDPFQWFMGEMFAQGCAEFQNLDYADAKKKIAAGKNLMERSGFNDVAGFVAPAWLVNPEVEQALQESGFRYHIYTDFWNYAAKLSMIPIKNLETSKVIKSREIAFDSSRKMIDYGTRGLAWLLTRNKCAPILRIAIHPKDIHNEKPFDYALKLLEEAKQDRELVTYREVL